MSIAGKFICYNETMYWKEYGRTSPYRLNMKKKPAKTEGKFLYHYHNEDCPHGYETIEVTEEQWEVLVAEDRKEYSNNRRHDEKKTDLREDYYEDDEQGYDHDTGYGRYYSNKQLLKLEKDAWERLDDFLCECWDKADLVHTFDDRDFAIYLLAIENKWKQKKVAEELNLSPATVNRRVKVILQQILTEKMYDGKYSPKRLLAEADYRYYINTGETDSFIDIYVFMFLTRLSQDMVMRYLYCMFGTYQLFHYCFVFLYRYDRSNALAKLKPERLLPLLQPYSRKLYERHTRNMSTPFKLLFIFLELKCAYNLKKVGLFEKPANTAFIKKVRQTANRCHLSVEDLKNKRIFPFMQKEVEKRIEQFRKVNNLSILPHIKNHKKR